MSEVDPRRVIELVTTLGEDRFELGPLDREDLRNLLCEVLERRQPPADVPALKVAS